MKQKAQIEFIPTWLYIKQHNDTGLKYFGKTTNPNPYTYKGSGKYWLRHLNKHGKNITTNWCQLFTDKATLIEYAINFSNVNNIVESVDWANLKPESGVDGGGLKGQPGTPHTAETKNKLREYRRLQIDPRLGKKHSSEAKQKIRDARSTQIISKETCLKISISNRGKKHTDEAKKSISLSNKGKQRSAETKLKLSVAAKNRTKNPMLGKKHSEEAKQRMRDAKAKSKEYYIEPA